MTADNSAISSVIRFERLPDGKFAPGSGGRVPGSKNKISNEAITAIKGMADEAITQLREKLIAGDWDAVTFVLERILPKGRAVELTDTSPSSIATALANGEIAPDEARSIATALARLNEIGELADIRAKLEQLEKLLDGVAR
ncbi:hypothetical protein FJ945_26085 [Mesorhizobium sp. B2-4-9]|uniref:hypothetical protein n=1 Tax=Mesorhizobium sp. B2-4-9 TaxID=2589940 RepID=UPI001128BCEF|nr:hypothetical protein [Mesorhizobium sp. B2-4-9]TPL16959.1 hypothetical protein FJ945_26085 [Mesorhizobium sp. B2-4-9]